MSFTTPSDRPSEPNFLGSSVTPHLRAALALHRDALKRHDVHHRSEFNELNHVNDMNAYIKDRDISLLYGICIYV